MPEARREIEARYSCPVCLGATLEKWRPVPEAEFVLDRCGRCGGMWFDGEEVEELRRLCPEEAWRETVIEGEGRLVAFRMTCHSCHAAMDILASKCVACGWRRALECPACAREMRLRRHGKYEVDVCSEGHGVWLDHAELLMIWSLPTALVAAAAGGGLVDSVSSSTRDWDVQAAVDTAIEVAAWVPPDVLVSGAAWAAKGASRAAGSLITHAPELATGAVKAAGGLAEVVFGAICDLVGGVLN